MRSRAKTKALIGTAFLAVFVVIFLFVNYDISSGFDASVFKLINSTLNVSSLNSFFVALSEYGREYFWIPVVALIWFLGKEKEKKGALLMVAVFIVIMIVGTLIKDGYYRARPFLSLSGVNVLIAMPADSSFPSGHAMIVIGGAVAALLFLRKKYSIPLLIEALLVCYSRIYVGVHYPTDVIGGAFLGAGLALMTYYLLADSAIFSYVFKGLVHYYDRILKALHV